MAIDEAYRGVPLAFLLFSAPSGNSQTSSGYNTQILTKLLRAWKTDIEHHQNGPFTPCVTITDTDLKEQGALVNVFPDIWLLICKFHLHQSWRNHCSRLVKGSSTLHNEVRTRLKQLENTLLASTEHADALQAIADERGMVASDVEPVDANVAAAAIEHIDYLQNYWLQVSLWRSWSQYGRLEAAKRLGCDVDGVLPTTNHLESFNGLLKRKHLRCFQRGGRRLRIDVLLHLLVTNVLPSIFEAHKLEQAEDLRWQSKLGSLPGGAALVQQKIESNSSLHTRRKGPLVVSEPWYALLMADTGRDAAAAELVEAHQISIPTFDNQTRTFEFECFSSTATEADIAPLQYALSIGLDGSARCACPDFVSRGVACKHLRAALTQLAALCSQGISIPAISLPTTYEEARTRFHGRTPIVSPPSTGTSPLDSALPPNDSESPSPDALPAAATPLPPSILVTRYTAQLVEEIVRESGDLFLEPGDRRFAVGDQTLDGDEEAGLESDSESSESEDENIGVEEEEPPVCKPGRPAKALAVAREGVVRQAIARVLHELESISPSLQHMRELLEGAYLDISEVDRTRAAKGHLDALSSQLSRMLLDAAVGDSRTGQPSGSRSQALHPFLPPSPRSSPFPLPPSSPLSQAMTPTPMSRKRSATTLLPPSPEKLQKRQDSYSIH